MNALPMPIAGCFLLAVVRLTAETPISGPGLLGALAMIQLVVGLGFACKPILRRLGLATFSIGATLCALSLAIGSVWFDVDTELTAGRIAFGVLLLLAFVAVLEVAIAAVVARAL